MALIAIKLKNLKVLTSVGVTEQERKTKQEIALNIDMQVDVLPAAQSDDLRDTVDYEHLIRLVSNRLQERSYKLMERLAADIAAELLKQPRVKSLTVSARKFLPLPLDYVGVSVSAKQGEVL